jgi:phosphoglycerol transferase
LNLATYGAAAAMSSLVLTVVLQLWRADLTVPFAYTGDALWCQSWIKGIEENGWYLTNPRLGAPGSMQLYDFPQADNAHFLLLKLLMTATHDVALTFNLYYLLGFPLITVSGLFVMRRFGVSRLAGLTVSLLFTFLPYHFLRGQHHLFLASYFVVPLSVMVILWVYLDRLRWPWSRKTADAPWARGRFWASLAVMLLTASAGVYYAFFACYLLLVAGLASVFDRRQGRGLIVASTLVAVTTAGVAVNLAPTLIYQHEHGVNGESAARLPDEAEVYGLKIGHLLLTINQHVVGRLNPSRQRYDLMPLSVGEKQGATLGAVGSAGFLFLIALLLCRTRARQGEIVPGLAALNIAAVLLSTIGGFGSLFALFVSPSIRCYNRISIFIALFALMAVAILADRALAWWRDRGGRLGQFQLALAGLAIFGLIDEIGRGHTPDYAAIKAQFDSDREFAQRIEDQLPPESMVYQFPYFPFPESPPLNQLGDYELLRPYLHSRALRFSYGAMRGRATDHWQSELAGAPLREQVAQLIERGFRGIAIDRAGYADHAAEVERELGELLNRAPQTSGDQRLAFFALPVNPAGPLQTDGSDGM